MLAAIARRQGKLHHLGDGGSRQAKTTGGFSLRDAFHKYSTTNGSIKFHSAHPLGVPHQTGNTKL
jgi:hypothetical protein